MSRTYHHGERRIRVRGVKKDPPDLRRLARALIALAQAEAEATAEDGKTASDSQGRPPRKPPTAGKKTVAHSDDDHEDAV